MADRKIKLDMVRDYLMLLHSSVFVWVCLIWTDRLPDSMTATDTKLNTMLYVGLLYYTVDSVLVYYQTRSIFDAMIYHHFIASIFSVLFLIYQQGLVHYQFYGWNGMSATTTYTTNTFAKKLHQFSINSQGTYLSSTVLTLRFIPPKSTFRRPYQIFYLSLYAITYLVLTYYLLTCNCEYVHSEKAELKGVLYHNFVIKTFGLGLIGLEVYWFKESVSACLYVIRVWKKEKVQ